MFRALCLFIGYGFGCIQTSYIIGRLTRNIDIREHGSGNAGMTNTIRVMGPKAGAFVFVCDAAKAILGFILCTLLFGGTFAYSAAEGINGFLPGLYGGLGVILGHNFPFFLKFRGGKGIASTIGVILSLDGGISLILAIIGIPFLIISNIVSLTSLLFTGLFPVLMIIFKFRAEEIILGFIITALAYWQHRANIGRLIKGNERTFFKVHPLKKLAGLLRR